MNNEAQSAQDIRSLVRVKPSAQEPPELESRAQVTGPKRLLTGVTEPNPITLDKDAALRAVSQGPIFAAKGDASRSPLFLERFNATSSGDFERALSEDAPSSPVMAA